MVHCTQVACNCTGKAGMVSQTATPCMDCMDDFGGLKILNKSRDQYFKLL